MPRDKDDFRKHADRRATDVRRKLPRAAKNEVGSTQAVSLYDIPQETIDAMLAADLSHLQTD